MKQIIRISLILIGLLLIFPPFSNGQASLSPYSTLGVGDIQNPALANSLGTGGLGLSQGNSFWLNNLNPALLPYNSLTTFAFGTFSDYRIYNQGDLTDYSGGANLRYLATCFPLKENKWALAISLSPYSNVNYNYNYRGNIQGNDTEVNFEEKGSGGINQLSVSTGIQIAKNLTAGVKASYMFGSIKRESSNIPLDTLMQPKYIPVIYDRQSVSDLAFGGGLSYRQQLAENTYFNVGFIVEDEMNLNTTRLTRIETRTPSDVSLLVDTTRNNTKGRILIPRRYGGGISFSQDMKWTVGIDYYTQNWADFRNFDGQNQNFEASSKFIVGGQLIPNFTNPETYTERIAYRLGFSYESMPYTFDGNQLNEFGINIGWSLPVGRASVLDFAFRYGQRGTTDNNLIKERIYRFIFGVTFNDRWFVRRRFN